MLIRFEKKGFVSIFYVIKNDNDKAYSWQVVALNNRKKKVKFYLIKVG